MWDALRLHGSLRSQFTLVIVTSLSRLRCVLAGNTCTLFRSFMVSFVSLVTLERDPDPSGLEAVFGSVNDEMPPPMSEFWDSKTSEASGRESRAIVVSSAQSLNELHTIVFLLPPTLKWSSETWVLSSTTKSSVE